MAEISRGQVNLNTVLGAIGTYGAVGGGNLLGGLLGGGNNCGCSEDHVINRYEAAQSAKISELETEIKLRDANIYTDSKLNDLRNYMERKFDHVEHELCDQKVFNATAISNISCIQGQIAQLYGLTKLVVPNGSICPGWGDVTVSITPAPTTGA